MWGLDLGGLDLGFGSGCLGYRAYMGVSNTGMSQGIDQDYNSWS